VTETSWTYLKRVDFSHNVNRWYAVGVQPSLLDAVALVRSWGSREKNYRRVMVQPFDNVEAARGAADRLIRTKLRRGYQIVAGHVPDGIDGE
jgi:predicted DNA-binding WGR domain protein